MTLNADPDYVGRVIRIDRPHRTSADANTAVIALFHIGFWFGFQKNRGISVQPFGGIIHLWGIGARYADGLRISLERADLRDDFL